MVRFFNSLQLNTVCIYCVLVVFSFFLIPQAHSEEMHSGYREIFFLSKVKKLVEKIKKHGKELNQSKSIALMHELRAEVENYTGQKFKFDKCYEEVLKHLSNRGAKLTKAQSAKLKKTIKNKNAIQKKGKDPDDDGEAPLPITVVVGVTMALCGFFLYCVPIPICKTCGQFLIEAGTSLAVEGTVWSIQDNEDQEK